MALTDNLQAFWELTEASGTRSDSTANNNDLTDNNTVGQGTGVIDNCADFEEANTEYLTIANGDQTGLNMTSDFSISAWIKLESLPANDSEYAIVDRFQANDGYRINVFRTGGGTMQIRRGIKNGGSQDNYDVTTTLNTGTWYHFVWTFKDTGKANKLYKDGNTTPISDQTGSIAPASVSSTLSLGSGSETPSRYMDGLIDLVGIWDRELTSAEVSELYNSGSGLSYADMSGGGSTFTPKAIMF